MLKLILYSYLFLTSLTLGQILVQEAFKDHEDLAEAVSYITSTYTIRVMHMCKYCTSVQQNFQWRLLDYALQNFDTSLARLMFNGEPDDQTWNYNIFIINSADCFNDLIQQNKLKMFEAELYFLIVFTHTKYLSDEELNSSMLKIVKGALDLNVPHVVIMVEHENSEIVLYKSVFLDGYCGDDLEMEDFNHFHNGTLMRPFLFPHRMRNLNNCTLRAATYYVPPLVLVSNKNRNENYLQNNPRLGGIDGNLLRIIQTKLNFRLNFVFSEEWPHVYENGTAIGPFELLQNGSVDFVVGNLGLQNTYRTFFTASVVYHQSPIVIIVRSGLQYSSFKQLLCPFTDELWNLLIWLFFTSIAVIAFFRRNAENNIYSFIIEPATIRPTVFNLIVAILGLPVGALPKRSFKRLLFLCLIFFTFVLRNLYQGRMFDSLRLARRIPLPRSLDDLIRRRYFMLLHGYKNFYPQNLTWVVDGNYEERFALIESADESIRVATPTLVECLAHYNQVHWKTSRLTMIKDQLYLFQMVIYFRKHSLLKFAFNAKLNQLASAGIISYITKRYVQRKFQNMNEANFEASQISNETLYGLYSIYAGLIGLAIVVFVLEILSRRFALLQKLFIELREYE